MGRTLIALILSIAGSLLYNIDRAFGAGSGDAIVRNEYAQTVLSNKTLKAILYLPDEEKGYYRGTRFDWSGLIARVERDNHNFFCDFKQEHDPLNHDDIAGTAEEFGIETPPSFAQAKPGEPFIKIGIGVLERPDDSAYAFWKRYKIRTAGVWQENHSPNAITFHQSLQGPNGWAYDYTKKITLTDGSPELKITRRLKNTGSQSIETDHYDHNFLRIDNVPAGTNYSLEFRFEPRFGQDSKTQGCLEIKGKSLRFAKDLPAEQSIWVRLDGSKTREDSAVKIVNHATGAAMTITTDQPLSKLVLYSSGGVLAPEPFVKISVAPGQTQEWATTYRFDTDEHR